MKSTIQKFIHTTPFLQFEKLSIPYRLLFSIFIAALFLVALLSRVNAVSTFYDSFDKSTIDSTKWTKVDTENKLSVLDGDLRIRGQKSVAKWNDPALYSTSTFVRTGGRALVSVLRPTVHTATGPLIHFSPTVFPTGDLKKVGYGIINDMTGDIPFKRFNAVVPGAEIPYNNKLGPNIYDPANTKSIDYMTTTVLRPIGSYHLVTGGDFGVYPKATLIWVNDHGTDTNLYAGINDYNSNSQISSVRVVDLGGSFASQWGLSSAADSFSRSGTLHGSTVDQQGSQIWTTFTGTATTDGAKAVLQANAKSIVQATSDGIFEADMTSPSSGSFAGGIIFRYSDPQNYLFFVAEDWRWRLGYVQNGTTNLISNTGANLFGYNQTKRLRVRAHGNYVCVYVNDTTPLDCATVTFNNTASGVGIGNFAAATVSFDNFASWPKTITLPSSTSAFPYIPVTGSTVLANDTFTAADGTSLNTHSLDSGGTWNIVRGTWNITNNAVIPNPSGAPSGWETMVVTQTGQTDIAVSADITLPDNAGPTGWFAGVLLRYTDPSNYVWARFTGDNGGGLYTAEIELWEVVNGAPTPLCFTLGCITNATNLSNILLPNNTYTMTFVAVGDQIAAYMDGKLIVQGKTANLTGTKVGMNINQSADAISTFDNFIVKSATPDNVPPPEVTDLTVVASQSGFADLSWTPVADDASGTSFYRVYRSTTEGTLGIQINTDSQTTTGSYTDTSLSIPGTYYYTVRAVDTAGNESTGDDNKQVSFVFGDVPATPTPTPTPTSGPTPTPTPTNTPTMTPVPTNTPTPTPTPSGVNLLSNPSFETNNNGYPANWQQRPTGSWDNTVSRTGTASLKVTGPTGVSGIVYSFQNKNLTPGAIYTASVWLKTQNVTNQGLNIRYAQLTPTSVIFDANAWKNGTLDWTRISKTFIAPSNHLTGRYDLLWKLSSGDTAWFDDASLCEGTQPCL